MKIYEVEIQSAAEGQRLLQHVKAADEAEAETLVREAQGADVVILSVIAMDTTP